MAKWQVSIMYEWEGEADDEGDAIEQAGTDFDFFGEANAEQVEPTTRFEFDGYTLRLATAEDAALARAWCEADPEHVWEAGQENYWIEQKASVESWLLEDALGPVFFLKLITICETLMGGRSSTALTLNATGRTNAKEIEISIQSAPDGGCARLRTMQALSKGFAWLEKRLRELGVNAVYFNSKNRRLIQFALLRLGFQEVANDYEPSKVLGFRRFKRTI